MMKETEREVLESGKQRKKRGRGQGYIGERVWWRKIKRKKKKKHMDDRKKERKNNIKKRKDNLEILLQYFHNKF